MEWVLGFGVGCLDCCSANPRGALEDFGHRAVTVSTRWIVWRRSQFSTRNLQQRSEIAHSGFGCPCQRLNSTSSLHLNNRIFWLTPGWYYSKSCSQCWLEFELSQIVLYGNRQSVCCVSISWQQFSLSLSVASLNFSHPKVQHRQHAQKTTHTRKSHPCDKPTPIPPIHALCPAGMFLVAP